MICSGIDCHKAMGVIFIAGRINSANNSGFIHEQLQGYATKIAGNHLFCPVAIHVFPTKMFLF